MSLTAVKLLQALLLFFIPGWLTLLAGWKRGALKRPDGVSGLLFFSFLTSFCLSSLAGLFLAYAGWFSDLLLSGVMAVYGLIVLLVFRSPPRLNLLGSFGARMGNGSGEKERLSPALPGRRPGGDKTSARILAAILILAVLLFSRPVEYIFGGWDPGVYAATAVHLARAGSIVVEDRFFSTLLPEEREAFTRQHKSGYPERYPGFRLAGTDRVHLIPQFYHLYPVWLSLAYRWGGLEGMFYLTPLLGLVALLAVYLLARELWGKRAALIGVFLLSVNMVQIWQARFPTSEMLSQFLLFAGMCALARYLRTGENYFAGLAGLVIGTFVLSRIDALLIMLPLALFFYCRWFVRFRKEDLAFWSPLLVLTAASFLPHIFFGPRYARSVVAALYLEELPWKSTTAAILLFGFGLRALPRTFRSRLASAAGRRLWRGAGAGLLFFLLWYGYFLRPYTGVFNPDKTNLIELGWFLTLPGLLLGGIGMSWLILKNRKSEVWMFLLVVAAFSGVFLWRQMVHNYYMWASRRYAVAAIPGFILLVAWCLVELSRSRRRIVRWLAPVLFIYLAFATAGRGRVLWNHREYQGAVEYTGRLAGKVKRADLIAVRGEFVDKIPTVLDLVSGQAVLPLYDDELFRREKLASVVRRRFGSSPHLYLLSSGAPPAVEGLRFEAEEEFPFHSVLLERRWRFRPRKMDPAARDANFTVRVYRIVPSGN